MKTKEQTEEMLGRKLNPLDNSLFLWFGNRAKFEPYVYGDNKLGYRKIKKTKLRPTTPIKSNREH